jgi:putative CocE/NonD family hydrolase
MFVNQALNNVLILLQIINYNTLMHKSIFILGFFIISFFGYSQTPSEEIQVLYHQLIPMRDGIKLSGTIVKPKGSQEKLPCLFMLTPYIADLNQITAGYFAKNGYIVVTVDTRGRGNSEGIAQPFTSQDGKDGYDVCKWITEQDWSNGSIGMYGGSYLGMVQWLILKENPPGLKTIIPTASVCPGIDFPKRNNVFYTYVGPYLAFISGKTGNRTSFTDIQYWNQVYLKFFKGEISYSKMMEASGIKSEHFQTWLKHPLFDDYWKSILPAEKDFKQFNLPVLTITGYFDDDQLGAMHYYSNFMKYSPAKENHYLIIGPWDHSGTRRPQKELGELKFDQNAVLDINKIQLDWFNWILKGASRPTFLKDKVAYYTMGSNEWGYTSSLENLNKGTMLLYLHSDNGKAADIFHSGYLIHETANNPSPDTFRNDPLDVSYSKYDLEEGHLVNYAQYKSREAYKGAGVIYHSTPFDKDIILAGQIKLTVSIAMDVKDADFEILLYEIKPDGSSVYLTTDILRARYRNTIEKEELPFLGQVYAYVFKTPYLFVRKLSAGSRLRLIIRNLNSPHYQKNFQSGGNIFDETARDAKPGTFLLFHNNVYKSYIELPVYKIGD